MVETRNDSTQQMLFEFAKVLFFVFCFLVSIDLMGICFKASRDTVKPLLLHATRNPFLGLVLGIVVTSIIQSSSTTTSIVVGLVAGGVLPLKLAIPVVMGANIGTTVTNTIVSFGYANRKTEFERAFGASIVHDIFNIYATLILFPLEIFTGLIYHSSIVVEQVFEKVGGFQFVSPLKYIIHPVSSFISDLVGNHYVALAVSFVLLFISLKMIVENMKGIVMEKIESLLNQFLFRNPAISLMIGIVFTAIVQSSSVTTSMIVPLVGAGLITIEQVFPYTLGANIGTTITAILAALTVSEHKDLAVSVALAHLIFNVFGIMIIYPVRWLPIGTAKRIATYVSKSRKNFIIFLLVYISLHILPIIFAVID